MLRHASGSVVQPIDPEAGPPQSPPLARKREPTGLLHLGIAQGDKSVALGHLREPTVLSRGRTDQALARKVVTNLQATAGQGEACGAIRRKAYRRPTRGARCARTHG